MFAPWFHVGGGAYALNIAAVKDPKAWQGIAGASAAGGVTVGIYLDKNINRGQHFFAVVAALAAATFVVLKFATLPSATHHYLGAGFWGAAVLAGALVLASISRVRPGAA